MELIFHLVCCPSYRSYCPAESDHELNNFQVLLIWSEAAGVQGAVNISQGQQGLDECHDELNEAVMMICKLSQCQN